MGEKLSVRLSRAVEKFDKTLKDALSSEQAQHTKAVVVEKAKKAKETETGQKVTEKVTHATKAVVDRFDQAREQHPGLDRATEAAKQGGRVLQREVPPAAHQVAAGLGGLIGSLLDTLQQIFNSFKNPPKDPPPSGPAKTP